MEKFLAKKLSVSQAREVQGEAYPYCGRRDPTTNRFWQGWNGAAGYLGGCPLAIGNCQEYDRRGWFPNGYHFTGYVVVKYGGTIIDCQITSRPTRPR